MSGRWILVKGLLSGIMAMQMSALGAEHDQLKAFPAAKAGIERKVIVLPHKERGEEDDFKVELTVGKMMLTDGVNLMRLGTEIKPMPLKGWGYTFYEVAAAGPTMSTMMAPPAGAKKVERLVTAAPLMMRYNSRLPIVVYVPKGYVVEYRIWSAPKTREGVENG